MSSKMSQLFRKISIELQQQQHQISWLNGNKSNGNKMSQEGGITDNNQNQNHQLDGFGVLTGARAGDNDEQTFASHDNSLSSDGGDSDKENNNQTNSFSLETSQTVAAATASAGLAAMPIPKTDLAAAQETTRLEAMTGGGGGSSSGYMCASHTRPLSRAALSRANFAIRSYTIAVS